MDQRELLLHRLDQIAASWQKTGKARALIGFGSAGIETDRMDEYSDLDFLAIVKKGYKKELSENLDWLTEVAPISYCFIDKYDAFRLFFQDGIYCEFGVCEETEVRDIPHSEGRIIWCEEDFDRSLRLPSRECEYDITSPELHIGEILTNLYVGLCRYARGEKLTAARYIERQALDFLLECSRFMTPETTYYKDIFTVDRRYEIRYPSLAAYLPGMLQGYEKCPESALAILDCTEQYFPVDPYIKARIVMLADKCIGNRNLEKEK
jgi:hypothetical protein